MRERNRYQKRACVFKTTLPGKLKLHCFYWYFPFFNIPSLESLSVRCSVFYMLWATLFSWAVILLVRYLFAGVVVWPLPSGECGPLLVKRWWFLESRKRSAWEYSATPSTRWSGNNVRMQSRRCCPTATSVVFLFLYSAQRTGPGYLNVPSGAHTAIVPTPSDWYWLCMPLQR